MIKNISLLVGVGALLLGGFFVFRSYEKTEPDVTNDLIIIKELGKESTTTDELSPPLTDKSYTLKEVALHNSISSCFTVIRGSVYDLTSWVAKHPGGEENILSLCGKDGTQAFEAQHEFQSQPEKKLASFRIGILAK